MAFIKCNYCGANISDKAHRCPKCGHVVFKYDNVSPGINTQANTDSVPADTTVPCKSPVDISEFQDAQNVDEDKPVFSKSTRNVIIGIAVAAIIILIIFLLLGKNEKTEVSTQQNTSTEEVELNDADGEAVEIELDNSVINADFTTPDLQAFEARGHVKSLKYSNSILPLTARKVEFDEKGNWINFENVFDVTGISQPGLKGVKTYEDITGRLSNWSIGSDDPALSEEYSRSYTLTWDDDKIVRIKYRGYEEWEGYDLFYNGGLQNVITDSSFADEGAIEDYQLRGISTDSNENWTERKWMKLTEKYDDNSSDYLYVRSMFNGGDHRITRVDSVMVIESRKIEYY